MMSQVLLMVALPPPAESRLNRKGGAAEAYVYAFRC